MNLFLNVGKKYKKTKLHNIQSLVFLINLYDEIKIKRIKAKKDKIKFLGTFAKHVKDSNNSILRALHLLRTTRLLNNGFTYQIEIKKMEMKFFSRYHHSILEESQHKQQNK